jgi:hypothetical protein
MMDEPPSTISQTAPPPPAAAAAAAATALAAAAATPLLLLESHCTAGSAHPRRHKQEDCPVECIYWVDICGAVHLQEELQRLPCHAARQLLRCGQVQRIQPRLQPTHSTGNRMRQTMNANGHVLTATRGHTACMHPNAFRPQLHCKLDIPVRQPC